MIYLGTATIVDDANDRYEVYAGIKWLGERAFSGTLGGNCVWDVLAARTLTLELPTGATSDAPVRASIVVDAIIDNEIEVRGEVVTATAPGLTPPKRSKVMGGVVRIGPSRSA